MELMAVSRSRFLETKTLGGMGLQDRAGFWGEAVVAVLSGAGGVGAVLCAGKVGVGVAAGAGADRMFTSTLRCAAAQGACE
jgi:hypothetical protein